ncbi:MAG TPA: hypothetical protein VMZ03_02660 [Chitinophagaceae bacterium]|nr:hypothetical protein [Chitinophagaceae bacterium]
MKKIFSFCLILLTTRILSAQMIIPITFDGKKYEVLDMSAKGKVLWGGTTKMIPGNAAKSESDGAANTVAIVAAVGENAGAGIKGVSYAAKLCSDAENGGKKDWYLPSKNESDAIYAYKAQFRIAERGSIWTSTEVNGTQAVSKYWYNGNFYNLTKVDTLQFLCIRKVE